MSRPRTTEDIEAVRTRAAVRLERRRKWKAQYVHHNCGDPACLDVAHLRVIDLRREAAVLVAAIDALLDENMEAWARGDR